jgi:chemotaxis protein methyltransferase CheR
MIEDPGAVTLLARLVETRSGLHYLEHNRELLTGKLQDHADRAGFVTLLDFYRSIEYADPRGIRLDALIDDLVVCETFFFRERTGLDRIVDLVAARWARGVRTRIWSAACATGEEIVSLAVLLARARLLERADLVASDLSERQVTRARRGVYSHRALRLVPEGMPPWIRANDAGAAMVDPQLLARVDWRRVNLVDASAVAALGRFDAILCRNVLIYFEDTTLVRVVGWLTEALGPDGILLIGAAESLLRYATVLRCVEARGTFLYQRAGAA